MASCNWLARTLLSHAFTALAALAPAQSPHPGMGSIPVAGGVSFRVWAPHATSVHVRGTFNAWSLTNPLVSEGDNGLWSAVVPTAHAGDPFKYYVTNTSPVPPTDTTAWRRDPYSRLVDQFSASDSNSVVYDPASFNWGGAEEITIPPINRLVIYQLHVGSFNAPTGTPATFAQAAARLNDLVALGVNAVELLPVHEGYGTNRWGYDPLLLYAVQHDYGGPDGFKGFVKACHQRGLAVIADAVYNHAYGTGNDLWDFDLWEEGTGGGIWFFNDATNRDSPWGPRYNYPLPQVKEMILNNVRMYFSEFHVDGIRFDATRYIRKVPTAPVPGGAALLQEITESVHSEFPGRLCIAEDFDVDQLATAPVNGGGLGFDAEWNAFSFMVGRLLSVSDANRNLADLEDFLTQAPNGSPFHRVIYSESHDTAAAPNGQPVPYGGGYLPWRINQVDPSTNLTTLKLSMLGSVLTLTAPGVPMLFMGQELYATGNFAYPNPSAMAWSTLEAARPGIRTLHRDLVGLRLNASGSTAGLQGPEIQVYHVNNAAHVVAYRRYDATGPGDDVVVLLNLAATDYNLGYTIGVPRAGTWQVRFNSDLNTYDSRFTTSPGGVDLVAPATPRDGMPAQVTMPRLPPYTAIILSQPRGTSGWLVRG